MSEKIVLCFSGGLDSTVLLSQLVSAGFEVIALSVNYGQKHRKEIDAGDKVISFLREARGAVIAQKTLNLSPIKDLLSNSALTSEVDVPEGHYADENMRVTVVPNRNMVLLALATACAVNEGAAGVAYAAHAGDHDVYPDCRPEFINAMGCAIGLCDFSPLRLITPFERMSKADVANLGQSLGAPMHLSWSCYKGREMHCGRCATCVERIEAFALAQVIDQTEYADSNFWRSITGTRGEGCPKGEPYQCGDRR